MKTEYQSRFFGRNDIGRAILVLLAAGCLAGRVLAIDSAGGGFWTNTTTWVGGVVPTISDDVTIKAGHTVTNRDLLAHDIKSLTIESGGVLTHTANATTEIYKLILNITGNLAVNAGGQINVDGRGYSSQYGPGQRISGQCAGSHGGTGGPYKVVPGSVPGPTYGSITAPTNIGCGGEGQAGGGAALFVVNGISTVNGLISASGMYRSGNSGCSGAGGSVFLTTGSLAGSGTIMADGGNEFAYSAASGGGGRIAVILTNSSAFGNLAIHAYPGTRQSGTASGAGTVYLQTQTQGPGKGTLVIDAGNRIVGNNTCLISSNVTGTVVGTVIITNQAIFEIAAGQSLTVNGSWTNAAAFIPGGTVIFAGADPATVYGSNTFYNLTCTTAGKILNFQTNSITTIAVGGKLTLTGASGNQIRVQRASAGTNPKLTLLPGSLQALAYVAAQNSDASGGDAVVVPTGGTDLGGNLNWYFTGGQTIAWTGTASTNWGTDANWSLARIPTYLDTVIISNTARKPSLDANRLIAGLTNQAGAVLNLNGGNLSVSGRLRNAGAIAASAGETLALNGDADFTGGTFTPQASTVVLGGALAQSFTPGGNTFNGITVANTNGIVTFQDGFNAHDFLCIGPGSRLTFHNGLTYGVTNLTLVGAAGSLITLRSAVSGSAWNLNLGGVCAVNFVDVKDSNAGGGRTVYAFSSTDSGANPNWDFGSTKKWMGATSVDFANGLNWSGGAAPGPADYALIDGDYVNAPRITAATTVGLLNVGNSKLSTLTVDAVLTVAGDAAVGQYGVLTHTANSTDALGERYKIIMNVANDLVIYAGGQLNADARGYSGLNGPGKAGTYGGGGYGGMGGHHSSYVNPGTTYGSITAPTNLGSGGGWSASGNGGGAVVLAVNGATALNGMILARSAPEVGGYQGSGGAVFLTTGTLAGSGTINVNALDSGPIASGGGGRVSVILTNGNDFGNLALTAYSVVAAHVEGAPGTVYTQTRDQGPGGGTLVLNANNIMPSPVSSTLINSNVAGCAVGTVLITNAAKLRIDTNQTLTVNRDWINTGGTNLFFIANTGSLVILGSTNTATVSGSNAFFNLACTNADKAVFFTAGTTNFIAGQLALGPRVTLKSTVDDTWWHLTLAPGGTQQIGAVTVQDSNAGGGQELVAAKGSLDLGHNVNWVFQRYAGTIFRGQ